LLAWAIIGAAVTGTMVFRVADPWIALLMVAQFEVSLAFVVLVATLVLALFVQRPFCRYACPLGAVQSLVGKLSPIAVQRDSSACLGCDLRNQACPMAIPVNTPGPGSPTVPATAASSVSRPAPARTAWQ